MGIAELIVLLCLGLFTGILSTLFDIVVVGTASFLTHVALWVLLNALLAAVLESRLQACLWSIPFNLGWVEAYFLTTSASYEGFARSLVVPLTAVAFLSPFLVYALWTAKSEKNAFGKGLSIFLAGGTLAASYLINEGFSIFNVVTSILVALVLLWLPVRRFKLTRKPLVAAEDAMAAAAKAVDAPRRKLRRAMDRSKRRDASDGAENAAADGMREDAGEPEERRERRISKRMRLRSKSGSRRSAELERRAVAKAEPDAELEATSRKRAHKPAAQKPGARRPKAKDKGTEAPSGTSRRPTKRKGGEGAKVAKRKTMRERRAEREREERQREERRREATRRRSRQPDDVPENVERDEYDGYVSRLGTSRTARPSTRKRQ